MTASRTEILLVEPSSGISGDMFISSLLNLGLDSSWLIENIKKVLPEDPQIKISEGSRGGISGTTFEVRGGDGASRRNLKDIKDLIERSSLPEGIKKRATNMFELLAEVEADVHGVGVKEVHFHEVGALDSIADIIGASAGVWKVDPDRVFSTPVNLGSGTVETAHGELPVPAPATAEILRRCEAPSYSTDVNKELTTPTGALILATFVDDFFRPKMKSQKIGYGIGSHKVEGRGNFLRTTLGISEEDKNNGEGGHELVLETNIDDMNPELLPVVEEKLLEAGALDVFTTPVQMKKNRPGVKLTVICDRYKEEKLARIIFQETTTLGIRTREVDRWKLDREIKNLETEFGPVKIKIGYLDGEPVNYSPEFESCQRLAEENDVSLKEVYREAIASTREQLDIHLS
ncbi:nickel pincer cofactor biosynthesis protein LarC [Candidatus Bipolaricaulota bacterium]|nr:nickel pincer cofactor biosynthesis protein LarC [Candidatus Bipolaricaulota bacterium]